MKHPASWRLACFRSRARSLRIGRFASACRLPPAQLSILYFGPGDLCLFVRRVHELAGPQATDFQKLDWNNDVEV